MALRKNLENKFIDRVYLVPEEDGVNNRSMFSHEKLFFAQVTPTRQTFASVFSFINENMLQNELHIPIVANSDIYFDETLAFLRQIKRSQEKVCLTMSRHDVSVQNGEVVSTFFNRADSQDVWIFGPTDIPTNIGNYNFGKPGCDNSLLYELRIANYCIANAAHKIIAHHIHITSHRTYTGADSVGPPYLHLSGAVSISENGTLFC